MEITLDLDDIDKLVSGGHIDKDGISICLDKTRSVGFSTSTTQGIIPQKECPQVKPHHGVTPQAQPSAGAGNGQMRYSAAPIGMS